MCTSIVFNGRKTVVGWNLDLGMMKHRVSAAPQRVSIDIADESYGWLPLFGANARGEFVAMPTCYPYDRRSDPKSPDQRSLLMLDIDLLLEKITFDEARRIAEAEPICSLPGITWMAQLSNASGDALQIVPGQGNRFFEKPRYSVLTNFSPFRGDAQTHPYMGRDRYETATAMLKAASDDFDVEDCFAVLKAVAQTVCPTVVSMVFDVTNRMAHWCEERRWEDRKAQAL